jgi:hypothetical protein
MTKNILPQPRLKTFDTANRVWRIYYDDPTTHHEVIIRNAINAIRNEPINSFADLCDAMKRLGIDGFVVDIVDGHKWTSNTSIVYHFSRGEYNISGFGNGGALINVGFGGGSWSCYNDKLKRDGMAYQNLFVK